MAIPRGRINIPDSFLSFAFFLSVRYRRPVRTFNPPKKAGQPYPSGSTWRVAFGQIYNSQPLFPSHPCFLFTLFTVDRLRIQHTCNLVVSNYYLGAGPDVSFYIIRLGASSNVKLERSCQLACLIKCKCVMDEFKRSKNH